MRRMTLAVGFGDHRQSKLSGRSEEGEKLSDCEWVSENRQQGGSLYQIGHLFSSLLGQPSDPTKELCLAMQKYRGVIWGIISR